MNNVVVVFGQDGLPCEYVLIQKADLGEIVKEVTNAVTTISTLNKTVDHLSGEVVKLKGELRATEKAKELLRLDNNRLASILEILPDWVLHFFTGSTYRG